MISIKYKYILNFSSLVANVARLCVLTTFELDTNIINVCIGCNNIFVLRSKS